MSTSNKKLATDGTLLFISTLVVNAGNYIINLIFGRWLGPADFSEVSLLVTLLLMVSFFALAFQLTGAKFAAENSENTEINFLYKWLNKRAIYTGIGMLVIVLSGAVFWKDFFQTTSSIPFFILGFSLPFYLLMSVNRGIFQGKLQYRKLALTYQSEMWVRLIVSIGLVYLGYRVNGVAMGIAISLIATWWISRIKPENDLTTQESTLTSTAIYKFLLIILFYELSQILINNSDIILVKHFFDPHDAGLYAALALIGRIVYFGTWTVVTLLFPLVIKLEKEGKDHTWYFLGGLAVVALLAAAIIFVCYFAPETVINLLFGEQYLSVAPLLWKYGLATALFASSNVFVYYHMSLDRLIPVWITVVGGIAQIVLISVFHEDFAQVIQVQIYLMLGLITAMIAYHLIHQFTSPKKIYTS
ncbi:MAG: oligosaccharide flippase family protein [Cytophagales bacterium]|nr:oligosaccharide flippase family protein [Cytophagales bacterium]